jgi:tRNA threonylcarbamoyladenosine modification (KEOPS) complex  Pcc1 subunit
MCSRLIQAESQMTCYFFDFHDGRFSIDDQGSLYDSLAAVREEVRRSRLKISGGLSLRKNASQLHIDVRDAHGARARTSTLLVVIEVPSEDIQFLMPDTGEP